MPSCATYQAAVGLKLKFEPRGLRYLRGQADYKTLDPRCTRIPPCPLLTQHTPPHSNPPTQCISHSHLSSSSRPWPPCQRPPSNHRPTPPLQMNRVHFPNPKSSPVPPLLASELQPSSPRRSLSVQLSTSPDSGPSVRWQVAHPLPHFCSDFSCHRRTKF